MCWHKKGFCTEPAAGSQYNRLMRHVARKVSVDSQVAHAVPGVRRGGGAIEVGENHCTFVMPRLLPDAIERPFAGAVARRRSWVGTGSPVRCTAPSVPALAHPLVKTTTTTAAPLAYRSARGPGTRHSDYYAVEEDVVEDAAVEDDDTGSFGSMPPLISEEEEESGSTGRVRGAFDAYIPGRMLGHSQRTSTYGKGGGDSVSQGRVDCAGARECDKTVSGPSAPARNVNSAGTGTGTGTGTRASKAAASPSKEGIGAVPEVIQGVLQGMANLVSRCFDKRTSQQAQRDLRARRFVDSTSTENGSSPSPSTSTGSSSSPSTSTSTGSSTSSSTTSSITSASKCAPPTHPAVARRVAVALENCRRRMSYKPPSASKEAYGRWLACVNSQEIVAANMRLDRSRERFRLSDVHPLQLNPLGTRVSTRPSTQWFVPSTEAAAYFAQDADESFRHGGGGGGGYVHATDRSPQITRAQHSTSNMYPFDRNTAIFRHGGGYDHATERSSQNTGARHNTSIMDPVDRSVHPNRPNSPSLDCNGWDDPMEATLDRQVWGSLTPTPPDTYFGHSWDGAGAFCPRPGRCAARNDAAAAPPSLVEHWTAPTLVSYPVHTIASARRATPIPATSPSLSAIGTLQHNTAPDSVDRWSTWGPRYQRHGIPSHMHRPLTVESQAAQKNANRERNTFRGLWDESAP